MATERKVADTGTTASNILSGPISGFAEALREFSNNRMSQDQQLINSCTANNVRTNNWINFLDRKVKALEFLNLSRHDIGAYGALIEVLHDLRRSINSQLCTQDWIAVFNQFNAFLQVHHKKDILILPARPQTSLEDQEPLRAMCNFWYTLVRMLAAVVSSGAPTGPALCSIIEDFRDRFCLMLNTEISPRYGPLQMAYTEGIRRSGISITSVENLEKELVVHVMSARDKEAIAVREVFATASGQQWTVPRTQDRISYQMLKFHNIAIYLTFPREQGGDFAINHINDCTNFFKPELCIMTGICAGRRGESNLGDVVVATHAFNYQKGKDDDGGHRPEPILFSPNSADSLIPWLQATMSIRPWSSHTIRQHPKYKISSEDFLKRALYEYQKGVHRSNWLWEHGFDRSQSIIDNKKIIKDYDVNMKKMVTSGEVRTENVQLKLSENTEHAITNSLTIYGDFPEPSESRMESKLYYGVYASGSNVRADTLIKKYHPWGGEGKEAEQQESKCFNEARQQYRNTVAVEMEGASFYQALHDTNIKGLCVKGISDYGDHMKNDDAHEYAKEVAASFAYELILAYCASNTSQES